MVPDSYHLEDFQKVYPWTDQLKYMLNNKFLIPAFRKY